VNFDAHADVRPLLPGGRGHSGSPFRQALTHASGRCRGYHVAGLLPHSVARAHHDFVAQRRGKIIFRDAVTAATPKRLFTSVTAPILATFDIDAVDQAHAPGVSAPATGGLPADLWLAAAEAAGRSPRVSSVDVVEANPAFDRDGQTARLAALTVWHVLRGLAAR
jgi:formiminoglutamase